MSVRGGGPARCAHCRAVLSAVHTRRPPSTSSPSRLRPAGLCRNLFGVPLLRPPPAIGVPRLSRRARLVGGAPVLALLVLLSAGWAAPARAAPTWVWPQAGAHLVTRPFAPGPSPWSPGHRGADLPGAPGSAVLAAGAGRVSYAGLLAGRGVVVVVHGALRTTYEPVAPLVGVGQPVAAGQQIGTLDGGHEGCPVAACLHWGLRRGEDYLDPVRLVDAGPVRLLPRDDPGARPAPLAVTGSALPAAAPAPGLTPAAGAARPGVPVPASRGRAGLAGTSAALLLLGAGGLARRRG